MRETVFGRVTFIGVATLVALTGVGVAGFAVAANSPGAAPVAEQVAVTAGDSAIRDTKALTVEAAVKAAQAALEAAKKEKQGVTVAVVDRAGTVLALLHGDGAGPQSEESARRKAFTAVSFNSPTSQLAGRVKGDGATLRDLPGTLFLAGGVPVAAGGVPIAAIGVGGAPSGDIDERFANEGLKTLGG